MYPDRIHAIIQSLHPALDDLVHDVQISWLTEVYDAVYYSGPTGGDLAQYRNIL
jgi:hypothetical protein